MSVTKLWAAPKACVVSARASTGRRMRCRRFCIGVAAALGGLGTSPAIVAAAPVADGFVSGTGKYATGGIKGQNPSLPAFTSGWTLGTGSTKFHVDPTANGLTSAGLTYTAGGSVGITGLAADASQTVGRAVTAQTSGTYYMSGLYLRGDSGSIAAGAYAFMGWGNSVVPDLVTTGSTLQGVYVGFLQTAETTSGGTLDDYGDLVIRTRQNIGGVERVVDTILADGQARSTYFVNYFVVTKLTLNTSGAKDTLDYWVNPTSLASDATLTSTAETYGTVTVDTLASGADLSQLTLAESKYDGMFSFDEPRVATTLADLAAATPTAVPEPAAGGAAFVVGGLALLRRAGRRRRPGQGW